jgi:hypothetical protein
MLACAVGLPGLGGPMMKMLKIHRERPLPRFLGRGFQL